MKRLTSALLLTTACSSPLSAPEEGNRAPTSTRPDGGAQPSSRLPDAGVGAEVDAALESPRVEVNPPPRWAVSPGSGQILTAPEVWTVVWRGDERLGGEVNRFTGWVLNSPYWKHLAEYGVETGSARGAISIGPPPAALADTDFEGIYRALQASGRLPPAHPNMLVSFIVPSTTKITIGGVNGCDYAAGYHDETASYPASPFSVVLRCSYDSQPQTFDQLTEVLSHELAEAATDPLPNSAPAWQAPNLLTLGEIGDLCAWVGVDVPASGSPSGHYHVQRLYSSAAASTPTNDPCVPATGPAFGVAVVENGFDMAPSQAVTRNGQLEVVGTTSVTLKAFAAGPTPAKIRWAIKTDDWLVATPSTGENFPGETINVQLTAIGDNASYRNALTVAAWDAASPARIDRDALWSVPVNVSASSQSASAAMPPHGEDPQP